MATPASLGGPAPAEEKKEATTEGQTELQEQQNELDPKHEELQGLYETSVQGDGENREELQEVGEDNCKEIQVKDVITKQAGRVATPASLGGPAPAEEKKEATTEGQTELQEQQNEPDPKHEELQELYETSVQGDGENREELQKVGEDNCKEIEVKDVNGQITEQAGRNHQQGGKESLKENCIQDLPTPNSDTKQPQETQEALQENNSVHPMPASDQKEPQCADESLQNSIHPVPALDSKRQSQDTEESLQEDSVGEVSRHKLFQGPEESESTEEPLQEDSVHSSNSQKQPSGTDESLQQNSDYAISGVKQSQGTKEDLEKNSVHFNYKLASYWSQESLQKDSAHSELVSESENQPQSQQELLQKDSAHSELASDNQNPYPSQRPQESLQKDNTQSELASDCHDDQPQRPQEVQLQKNNTHSELESECQHKSQSKQESLHKESVQFISAFQCRKQSQGAGESPDIKIKRLIEELPRRYSIHATTDYQKQPRRMAESRGSLTPDTALKATSALIKKLSWKKAKSAPINDFALRYATAASHGRMAYFTNGKKILSFSILESKWVELASSGQELFGMAVIKGKLTTIGGVRTNKLKTFSHGKGWKEVYPAMPTMRSHPAAVTTDTHLVVAGGRNTDNRNTGVVEILDIGTRQWSEAKHLPQAVGYPKMAMNNDQIYLISHTGETCSCLIQKLLESTAKAKKKVWSDLADAPYLDMSLAVLNGRVLALGESDGLMVSNPATAMYSYDKHANLWREVGRLPAPLYDAVATVLSGGQILVVGRKDMWQCYTDTYIGSTI